jgi:predicted peptidase
MKINIIVALLFLNSCFGQTKEVDFFDQLRKRKIPVALYIPKAKQQNYHLVIFSHGYAENAPGANKGYSYLTKHLAQKGYFVASIQHELATDELLPKTGIPQIVRRPCWERGVENILFTINELKKQYPKLDNKHITLIGHSNGGDICVLFAHKYPKIIEKIISLDNRRMEIPRISEPKIYSLRSSDQPADEGVLPSVEEQQQYAIKIIKLQNTIHNDMSDRGTPKQKAEINKYVLEFLID